MSKIRLHGSSSGYTEIAPVAASGNNTLTLPNDGTIISKDSNGAVGVTSVHTTNITATGIATITTAKVGAAVTISESGIEASGIGITCANINGTQIGGRRNLVINGAMNVAQRGTSSTSSGYVTIDRFNTDYGGENEAPTYEQGDVASGTTPYTEGFRKTWKITNGNQTGGAGAGDYIFVRTKIEAQDLAKSGWDYTSSSSFVTLSFWVKSSVAQTFYGRLESVDGTPRNFPYSYAVSANTWTKVVKTIPGNTSPTIQIDDNNGSGMELHWQVFRGTNFTDSGVSLDTWATYASGTRTPDATSTWWTTNDATWELTGVQLEVGPQATAFEHRSFGEELSLCQRYYYKHAFGSSAGINQNISNNNMAVGMCAMYTGTAGFGFIPYPVTMRALPTLENATGTDYYRVYANGSADNFNDISTQQFGINGSVINYYDGFSRTQGHAGWIQCHNASAYIAFKAEL